MNQLPDGSVWQEDGEWVVDPEVIAPKLGLSTTEFRQAMRDGHVRGTVEHGEDDDAGRTRLTFRYANNAYAIQIEPDGRAHETTPPPNPRAAARGTQSNVH